MSVDDDLRLAWQAHRDGKAVRRDALLTLAVASAHPKGAGWVAAARDFLVASRPDHLFARFESLDDALADRRVVPALGRLRGTFPPARVRWLVDRSEALRGPFTGRRTPVAILLDELLGPTRARRRDAERLGLLATRPGADPGSSAEVPLAMTADPIVAFYFQVLLSIATLCAVVVSDRRDEVRAA